MQLSDDLLCMYTGKVESRNCTAVVSIPERELEIGSIETGDTYRVALYPAKDKSDSLGEESNSDTPERVHDSSAGPPVKEGEQVELEIEDVGQQGDGLARVGPGFVVFVSGAEVGDHVEAEITAVRENVAFAEVIR